MPILAITHAGRYDFANAFHMPQGLEDLEKIREIVRTLFFSKGEKLKKIVTGIGPKFEEILHVMMGLNLFEIFEPGEAIILSPALGTPESTRKNGGVISSTGSEFTNYISLADSGGFDPWKFLGKHFLCQDNEVVILCIGKQFMRALGKEEYFSIASVYELFIKNRSLIWRVKEAELLKEPIIG